MILLVMQWENVAGEEARQVLNEIDFNICNNLNLFSFIVASLLFAKDARAAKDRKPFNKALLMKLKPNLYKSHQEYAISLRSGSGIL